MKKILFLFVVVSLAFLGLGVRAARADTTWYPSSLAVGLDARSLGMGGACLGVVDPRFYPVNPAGLPFLTRQGVFAGRFVDPPIDPVEMSGDQLFLHLAYVHPNTGAGAYSIGAYQNHYYETDRYWDFKVLQYGYGYEVNEEIGLGFNLRPVARTDESSGAVESYVTLDAGAVFRLNEAVTAAVLVTDVTMEPRILFGGSIRFGELLLVAVDVERGFTNGEELLEATRLGVEVRPIPPLALRAGSYHGRATMGFGLRLGRHEGLEIDLDFAQYWPEGGAYASPTQAMGMTVYF
ncbi:MAG: hypothetical protein K6U03_08775 [Firmicutes bacterium]|nr:hypothetical protein [Bacillota bacterium]